jgi:CHAD domain-containing protein
MEVEVKFTIPDRATMAQLKRAVRLGPFVPGPTFLSETHDRYLDTSARALHGSGYALRRREREGSTVLTLKGLGGVDSGVHERIEDSIDILDETWSDVEMWPSHHPWDHVRDVVGDEELVTLFSIDQSRWVRELYRNGDLCLELSIDSVEIQAGEKQRSLLVLEGELCLGGTRADLGELAEHLVATWGLAPDSLSKYHHALALLDSAASDGFDQAERVTDAERMQLERVVETAEAGLDRERAQLILGWAAHRRVPEVAEEVGRSRSWAYHWVGSFRKERLRIFESAVAEQDLVPDKETAASEQALSYQRPFWPRTMGDIYDRYGVDLTHAHKVAEHALSLFDALGHVHNLPDADRQLLESMCILHNVGLNVDPQRHHIVGRDIVLGHSIPGLSESEQRMIAAAVYLHRKKIKKRKLQADVVVALPEPQRRTALELAALLRIADGLDYSQGQSTNIDEIHVTPSAVQVIVSGPLVDVDTARAQKKSDLWARLHSRPMTILTREAAALAEQMRQVSPPATEPNRQTSLSESITVQESPGLLPDDPMSEAGRKILYYHFARMLSHEAGTRVGEDPEDLHDMRVATRRLRAALRVFAPYYKKRTLRAHVKRLRRAARVLGTVRDLDVALLKARAYLASLPDGREHDLDPLIDTWARRRDKGRECMLAYLDSDRYADLKQSFGLFVTVEGRGAKRLGKMPPEPVAANHVLPAMIYTEWARVRAFEPVLDAAPVETLHALRIACKRLRYTLEFFRELLGPEAKDVIAEVVRLQDHLGDLNDADVAISAISDFLFPQRRDAPQGSAERIIAPGVVSYLAAKQHELQEAISGFPQIWHSFCRVEVRQWLASAVAAIE